MTDRMTATRYPWFMPGRPSAAAARAPASFAPNKALDGLAELVVKAVEIGGEPLQKAAFGHVVAKIDRTRKAESVRATVTLYRDPVEAEERPAVHATRIHLFFQNLEPAAGEQGADPRGERARQSVLEVLPDLPGRTLGRLQGDVAREALHDDDVDHPLPD